MKRFFVVLVLAAMACFVLVGCGINADDSCENGNVAELYTSTHSTGEVTSSPTQDIPNQDAGPTSTMFGENDVTTAQNNTIGTNTSVGVYSTSTSLPKTTNSNTSIGSSINTSPNQQNSFTNFIGDTTTSSQAQSNASQTQQGIVLPDDEW